MSKPIEGGGYPLVQELVNKSKGAMEKEGGSLADLLVRGSRRERLPGILHTCDVCALARRVQLNRAAVLDSEEALALLTELSTQGVLAVDVISQHPNTIVNTALLCQALLAEMDPSALRITPDGVDYIENLLNPS